jgi:hypothetical protein
MAQWKGQFSGRTHATKVRRLEKTLTVAVSALNAVSVNERGKKLKAVRTIATRLLSARLHMMKSRISAAREKQEESSVDALRSREEDARVSGVEAILREFGAIAAVDQGPNKPLQPTARDDARSG